MKSGSGSKLFSALIYYLLMFTIFASVKVVNAEDSTIEQETAVYSALSMGTGWALTQRHIVTNYHVIEGVHNLRLVTAEQKEIPVKVVLSDKENDLAVLVIMDEQIRVSPLPLALTRPRLGSQVFTVGYPHPNLLGTSPKLTSGFISAINGLADDPRTFQVSVPVQAGNSGGPLLNMRGEVVGVITSKLSAQKMFEWTGDFPQNVNYAIKVHRLSSLISELETDEQVKAGTEVSEASLEELAEKIIDSVIIVAGDGAKQSNPEKTGFLGAQPKHSPQADEDSKTIIVYSYAEPGNYDLLERVKGSDSIPEYSENTLKLLKQQLVNHFDGKLNFVSDSGKPVGRLFYKLEDMAFSQSLCKRHNASNIVASYSENASGNGTHFRYVSYRMIDCLKLKEFKKRYVLERDELHDQFGYEVALYTSFKDFIIKTPPYLSWLSDNK
jgi:S1-C subfamily serine protease